MKNFQELEEKVQKMMDGERKRRDIALKFVQSLQELLLPVALDLWGAGEENAKFVIFNRCILDTSRFIKVAIQKILDFTL
jgi:hypothetical protein